jgi:hypothetical protein
MACYDRKCPCSNAPRCKCETSWDVRCVCLPGEGTWNCPIRSNTAAWLIDNDENLHIRARKRDFEGIRGWFEFDDEEGYYTTVKLYCEQMIEELNDPQAEQDLPVAAAWWDLLNATILRLKNL